MNFKKEDENYIVCGAGGQGVLSSGSFLAYIFMLDGKHVTFCSSYGAEMRGGAVNCEVNCSDDEILNLQNDKADYIIALNQTSFDKFISKVKPNGTIIVNSSMVQENRVRQDINYIFAPLSELAMNLGNIKVANSIALGILSKITGNFSIETVKQATQNVLKNKQELIQKNIEAYQTGFNYTQKGDN